MERSQLEEYRKQLEALTDAEKKERDLYLRNLALGIIQGPPTGFPSIDKPWLKWYDENKINQPIISANAYDYFLAETSKFPNAVLLDYYGKKYTRRDIVNEVEEYIKRFKAMGLKLGDTVSFVMLNVPEVIFMWYALSKMGVIANMIKFDESSERIKYMLDLTKSKYLFASEVPFILENVKGALDNNTSLENVITLSLTESLPIGLQARMLFDELKMSHQIKKALKEKQNEKLSVLDLARVVKEQAESLKKSSVKNKQIIQKDGKFIPFSVWAKIKSADSKLEEVGKSNDISVIVYTGGTTGQPKGVKLKNSNLNAMSHNMKNGDYDFNLGKTSLSILPPAIAYYFNSIHGNTPLGVNVHLVSHFTPEEYPYLIKKYEPNIFMGGPILFENMRKANILKDASFMIAPISGGDKLYEVEEEKFIKYIQGLGAKTIVHQGWGMSEGTAASSYVKTNAYKLGSVGIPFVDLIVSVFEYGTDIEVPYNQIGELCITGPTIMAGYLNNPEATNGVLKLHNDGRIWLHTDDLGLMDNEGRIYHKGRAKRMLTRRGGKVWLSEIEDLASKHPLVDKCCCVKLDDEEEREVPVLHIVFKPEVLDVESAVLQVNELLTSTLSENYIPKFYVIRKELPYSEVNKKCDFKSLENEDIFNSEDYDIYGSIIIKRKSLILERNHN